MITFVYYYICWLIICCHTARIESEENDFNNDLPDTSPKLIFKRYKIGSHIVLKCNSHNPDEDNITWEFKDCKRNYDMFSCDDKDIYTPDDSQGRWKKLDFNRKRKKLEIENATEDSIGLYRCLYNDTIIKIYMVDLVVTANFKGTQPEIQSLLPISNATKILPNTPIEIQCKATSVTIVLIRWFRQCNSATCEGESKFGYHGRCYCRLPESNYAYMKNINNTYISKLSIDSSRSVDSGTYVCVVISQYGKDYKNVTISVEGNLGEPDEDEFHSFLLLFLIPLFFVLVPLAIWLGFYRRKAKSQRPLVPEHQRQLIAPVVKV